MPLRIRISGLVLLALLGSSLEASQAMLERYQWSHRLLLVFAPSEQDQRYLMTRQGVAAQACRFEERDLLLGWLPRTGSGRLADDPVAAQEQRALRERYGVAPAEFVVVLIGKDGTEKKRSDMVPDLDGIFDLIDGMPMRRQEVAARGGGCGN